MSFTNNTSNYQNYQIISTPYQLQTSPYLPEGTQPAITQNEKAEIKANEIISNNPVTKINTRSILISQEKSIYQKSARQKNIREYNTKVENAKQRINILMEEIIKNENMIDNLRNENVELNYELYIMRQCIQEYAKTFSLPEDEKK